MEEKPISAHDILMEHVTFSYTGKENVIHDVNLAIPEGAFYALVGPSGGGKSTLARLWHVSGIRQRELSRLVE